MTEVCWEIAILKLPLLLKIKRCKRILLEDFTLSQLKNLELTSTCSILAFQRNFAKTFMTSSSGKRSESMPNQTLKSTEQFLAVTLMMR